MHRRGGLMFSDKGSQGKVPRSNRRELILKAYHLAAYFHQVQTDFFSPDYHDFFVNTQRSYLPYQ